MVSKGRHPKQPIAAALTAVDRPGLEVVEIHKGHRWGALICTKCRTDLPIWSSPRVPEDTARNIHRFDIRHRHDEEGT
jgi:hypothetical protein